MRLADDFFNLAVVDGKPRLHTRALGFGLAGALLAELYLADAVTFDGDLLRVIDPDARVDALALAVLEQINAEPRHRQVRTWLDFLGQRALGDVGGRLVREGHAVQQAVRVRPWKTEARYLPTDPAFASAAWARLYAAADRGTPVEVPDRILIGLVMATGLTWQVYRLAGSHTRDYLAAAVGGLPNPATNLVTQVQAIAGATRRT